jgi:phospholipid/cholesterol/gamma-HCH transport system permease protein
MADLEGKPQAGRSVSERGSTAVADNSAEAVAGEALLTNAPASPPEVTTVLEAAGGLISSALHQTGEVLALGWQVSWSVIRHPTGFWAEAGEQFYANVRLVAIPMVISLVAFGLGAPGIQGGNLENIFGVPEQLGSFFVMASIREFAPWIDAMVVAGVVGTAITADLGARRIREELDALEVLGLDPIRELVVPRVVAVTFLTGLCDVAGVLIGAVGGYIAAVPLLGAAPGNFFHDFFANASVTDVWGSVVKTTIFGFIIGIVCSYKGLKAKGGPSGVGRAVNQAVVAAFALIWVVNYVFTDILLGTHPGIEVIK